MLRSLKELLEYELMANDGQMGKVHDFFFSDEDWTIRYLVVDTGPWIFGRKVLISPDALLQPVWASETFPVNLSREDVKTSPDVDLAKPVSRLHEEKMREYYNWPIYWGAASAAPGQPARPIVVHPNLFRKDREDDAKEESHLRSVTELLEYSVTALDGGVGGISDFIIDDENWQIRYMLVDTTDSELDTDKQVLIALEWVNNIDVVGANASIDLKQDAIKFSPSYDPSLPVNRQYEEVLYDYHGRPKYWQVVEKN